ncbi:MAG TPA: ECF-type sigma factor [Bryobacteraceae bacterium]|nr:ECF-type sigma factor [Bryobacteraceae bacterium]
MNLCYTRSTLSPEPQGEVTQLLHRWRQGSPEAESELFALVMPNLQRLAEHFIHRENPGHPMQATELVDTIYFRLVAAKDREWQSRRHFFAIAARAMRRYLIDQARGRPRGRFVTLGALEIKRGSGGNADIAILVDRLLNELAETRPEWSMLVEMKYFLGLTDEETADAMGLKLRTLQRMWRDARQWLFSRMEPDAAATDG